jgi:hypothetical protein
MICIDTPSCLDMAAREYEVNPATDITDFLPKATLNTWVPASMDIKVASHVDAAKKRNDLWLFKFPHAFDTQAFSRLRLNIPTNPPVDSTVVCPCLSILWLSCDPLQLVMAVRLNHCGVTK